MAAQWISYTTRRSSRWEMIELRGNQVAARECYIAMLEMDVHEQTMCIEE